MGILTLDKGLGGVAGIGFGVGIVVVHRTEDVGMRTVLRLLVLHRTGCIPTTHPRTRLLEINAIARLVAERPNNDGRVVLIQLYIGAVAVENSGLVVGVLGNSFCTIAHAMRFDIGFCHDIQPIAVAETIPIGVIRVVAGTHGIEIKVFHQTDVLLHTLAGHNIARQRVEFVAIDTLNKNRLSVEEQLRTYDLHMTEADILPHDLDRLTRGSSVREVERIEVRLLCRPGLYAGYCLGRNMHRRTPYILAALQHGVARLGEQHIVDTPTLGVGYRNIGGKDPVPIIVHEVLTHEEVFDMRPRCGIEIDITAQSAKAPKILVLDIRPVAPTHDLQGYEVVARTDIAGNIEDGCRLAVLTIADLLTIDIDLHIGGCFADREEDLLSPPYIWQHKVASVRTDMIILLRHKRRVVSVLLHPYITDVTIERLAIALQLLTRGDGYLVPRTVIERKGIEV